MIHEDLSKLVTEIREANFQHNSQEQFLDLFSEMLLQKDCLVVEFDGDNYQSGKQYGISFNAYQFNPDYNLDFEVAFSFKEDFFKIYTRHHNGYWNPEYVSSKFSLHPRFEVTFKKVLLEELGF